MTRPRDMFFTYLALVLSVAARASADAAAPAEATPHTYALLIGSNPGGEGQATLRYAEHDAEHLAAVFTQLGRFPLAQTRVLLGPDRAHVLGALDEIGQRLAEHRARGEQVQFVFYYSGHARSTAIQLGSQELPLSELRERILALPTTLTLVVLDACQSGAFTNVKGARSAAAFSYNSVSRLRTTGVAVMASSSASELSQESEQLHGSYFTHHLMVGLRGAGDRDRDGMVSLAEAYRYAYERTLSATARTAVGGQHVTLETALTGQGEVPLTYPAQAGAQLELAAGLDADVILEHDDAVVAELHKVPGNSMRLALPAGAYTAVLRQRGALAQCALLLADARVTPLVSSACQSLSDAQASAKGLAVLHSARARRQEQWAVELTLGLGQVNHDTYTRRLDDFAFSRSDLVLPRLQLAVSHQLGEYLSAVVDLRNLDGASFIRPVNSTREPDLFQDFDWWSVALSAHLRAHIDASRSWRFFAQLGIGPGLAVSKLAGDSQLEFGPVLSGAAGMFYMPFGSFGFTLQMAYSYAPLLRNELDDVHNSGGLSLSIGLRLRTWSQP